MHTRIMGQDPRTYFRVGLDDLTVARLMEFADSIGQDPSIVIACLIHDVMEDDARMHEGDFAPLTVQ